MLLPHAIKKSLNGTIEIWTFMRETFYSFLEDHGLRMAASLAFYTTFSITPAMLIGLSVAGVVIGDSRAESELTAGIGRLINPEAADYVFSLVARFSAELRGSHLPLIGILGALVAATAVFVELQSALNVIWRVALRERQGLLGIIRSRAISFVFVVGIGILLLVSVVTSAVLATINGLFMKTLPIPREDPALAANTCTIRNGSSFAGDHLQAGAGCKHRMERRVGGGHNNSSFVSAGQIGFWNVPTRKYSRIGIRCGGFSLYFTRMGLLFGSSLLSRRGNDESLRNTLWFSL